MSVTILVTKLHIPRPRPSLVIRSGLIEQLNEGLKRKLTLVSAPAGFGKTTLLSEWVTTSERAVAWLSLDEDDSDPIRFLTYLVAALQSIMPEVDDSALAALQSPQPPRIDALLTTLLNEIAMTPHEFNLVLDDYHLLDSLPINEIITYLLEHLPPQMHLVIATREDPPLPLARLRARGQLTELRAADLRFTGDEAAKFLNQVMSLHLSAEHVAALETRTEGWIVGLQLAALSMQGKEDVDHFIQSFTGSHHFVLDYLVEEVLQQQPESVQMFLLNTSILDRLCGPLCDAVLQDSTRSGQTMLDYLERANLFVIPLDDERYWYRYHHLFADLLRQRLHRDTPSSTHIATELHNRASLWYEANGHLADAFRHALAAEDAKRAANLAELAWASMDRSFQSNTWLGWLKQLPDALICARPVLCVQHAQALMDAGELEASESRLRDAERWLFTPTDQGEDARTTSTEMVVVDDEQFELLPVTIAMTRAYNAQAQGDAPAAIEYAQQVYDLLPEADSTQLSAAAGILGMAHWSIGDLEAAYRSFTEFVTGMQNAGNAYFAIAGYGSLAEIIVAQGRLQEAVRTYKRSLQLASTYGASVQRLTAHLHLGLALVYHEMWNTEGVAQHLQKAGSLGEQMALIDWPYRWHLAQARFNEAEGDFETALDMLDEAQRLYVRNPAPDIRPIEALKSRIHIRQGRLREAEHWRQAQGFSVDDALSYLREFEHMTLVRLLIAQYKRDHVEHAIRDALRLLERLLQAAEAGGRMGSRIELLVLQALAHEVRQHIPLALAALARALTLAEPEGYIRIFVNEGMAMARLLSETDAQKMKPDYVGRLLAAFEAEGQRTKTASDLSSLPASTSVQPLTSREREVLNLMVAGHSNPEIAAQLFIAVTTVKTHVKNIFEKLAVTNRVQAVVRTKELNLL